jgi:adenine/guanine phosphoribosyltransferase-like PRPP-binding protein
MSDFPHQSKRVLGLEAWGIALATALVALIAVGVVPHVHW